MNFCFLYTGWPSNIENKIYQGVLMIIKSPELILFRLGRTNNPIATKTRHQSDDLILLYKTESPYNAMEMEDRVLKRFILHRKCVNISDNSGGGLSHDYIHYVYLAPWWNSRKGRR